MTNAKYIIYSNNIISADDKSWNVIHLYVVDRATIT